MSQLQHPWTPVRIREDLERLGVSPGQTIMVHASMNAVGPVMGGPTTVVQALLDVLSPAGTLMMYVGWHDIPDAVHELSGEDAAHYRAHFPAFDPATARAVRDHGVLAECVRTWPGAQRSLNAEASMVAVGARAAWITADHPRDFGYGQGSPLDKLVQSGGSVVLLGSPLDTVTLLHHAEYRARIRHKRQVRYGYPVRQDGRRQWVEAVDFDTGDPLDDYTFEQIMGEYLAEGRGRSGMVGQASSYRIDAADLTGFAVAWLEARFGR